MRVVDDGRLSEHSGRARSLLRLSEGQLGAGKLHRSDEIRSSAFLQEAGKRRLSLHRRTLRRGAAI